MFVMTGLFGRIEWRNCSPICCSNAVGFVSVTQAGPGLSDLSVHLAPSHTIEPGELSVSLASSTWRPISPSEPKILRTDADDSGTPGSNRLIRSTPTVLPAGGVITM